ncbi:MAG: hypothetical protein ACTHQM_24760 [Thermoanaerobaculia bacterium]
MDFLLFVITVQSAANQEMKDRLAAKQHESSPLIVNSLGQPISSRENAPALITLG